MTIDVHSEVEQGRRANTRAFSNLMHLMRGFALSQLVILDWLNVEIMFVRAARNPFLFDGMIRLDAAQFTAVEFRRRGAQSLQNHAHTRLAVVILAVSGFGLNLIWARKPTAG